MGLSQRLCRLSRWSFLGVLDSRLPKKLLRSRRGGMGVQALFPFIHCSTGMSGAPL